MEGKEKPLLLELKVEEVERLVRQRDACYMNGSKENPDKRLVSIFRVLLLELDPNTDRYSPVVQRAKYNQENAIE